jgi:hypothetical protein
MTKTKRLALIDHCSLGILAAAMTIFALGWSPPVQAASIASRAALQALLVGPGTLEDFETFSVSVTGAELDCSTLDSAAICNGQGPGLVVPGVSIGFLVDTGQWNPAGFFGAPSREILSSRQPLVIDFTVPVQAFGVDLRAFSTFPATATIAIFATDDATSIGTLSSISLPTSGAPVFAGWEDPAGIGRLSLTQSERDWSPIVDNLEFGVIPEPACAALLGLGLAGLAMWRRLPR